MEYTDSRKKPLHEGLYRDKRDKSYVLYLSKQGNDWMFQTPASEDLTKFPLSMSKDIEPIHEPIVEIENFKAIIGFLEKKIR